MTVPLQSQSQEIKKELTNNPVVFTFTAYIENTPNAKKVSKLNVSQLVMAQNEIFFDSLCLS